MFHEQDQCSAGQAVGIAILHMHLPLWHVYPVGLWGHRQACLHGEAVLLQEAFLSAEPL